DRENQPASWFAGLADRPFLIPILEPEQPPFFSEDARRVHQSLRALTQLAPLRRSGRLSAEVRSLVGPIAAEGSCPSAHVCHSYSALAADRAMLCIVERSLLGSPLVVVGKSLKLSRNRLVRHGFGRAEQSLRCLQIFFPRCDI